jgi:hypothetical protein
MANQFNALTGPEVLQVILSDIEEKLVKTGDFPHSITFPWFRYSWEVKVTAYPQQGKNDEPKFKLSGGSGTKGDEPVGETPMETVVSNPGKVVDTPDQARKDAGLPIPTPAPGVAGVVVDKLVESKTGRKK